VIELEDFEREGAIASLKAAQQVNPVTLDAIREPLVSSLVSLSVLRKCLTVRHSIIQLSGAEYVMTDEYRTFDS
jgi:hypothetical protein